MWTADFPQQLLWMRYHTGLTDGLADVPSWSWASKLGPRMFWSQPNDYTLYAVVTPQEIDVEDS